MTSVYILGYAFGPLVIAPLSELYGRVIVYNVCNFIFLIFTIACALANNLSALIVFRLLAGIAASSPVTLGAGTIADIIPLEKREKAMASYLMGPLIGPTVGPLSGYSLRPFRKIGLTLSSWWLPCPSQGLALDFLAHIYLGEFKAPQSGFLTDETAGRCRICGHSTSHARILPLRDPATEDQPPAERDGKRTTTIRFGHRQRSERAVQVLSRTADQNVVPVTDCLLNVALHGHGLRLPVPIDHDLPSSIPDPIRFLERERGTDILGCRDRVLLRLSIVWSSFRSTGGGANQAQRRNCNTRISSPNHVHWGSDRTHWSILVRLDSRQEGALDSPYHWHWVPWRRHVRRIRESSSTTVGESWADFG